MNKAEQLELIEKLVTPVLESSGYQLVDLEFDKDMGRRILRLYIDKDGGITLDNCTEISHALSAFLDVEDPLPGAYLLEVSSPGIERPLRFPKDFVRFAGETIKLSTVEPIDGRQNYRGILIGSDAQTITMNVDGKEYTIPFSALAKARIVKDWNQKK